MFTIGGFAIIFDPQGRVLLCHRRDMDMWNLPGGGLEGNELPNETALRETREETGLEVEIERLVGVYGKNDNDLVFTFQCRVVGGQLSTSDESDEYGYFPIDQIPLNTSPKHVERIRDAQLRDAAPVFRRQGGLSSREYLESTYSLLHQDELLKAFETDAVYWSQVIAGQWGADFSIRVVSAARLRFAALVPQVPYIGGDGNHLTGELLRAARCLALYQAMQAGGKSAAETGKVLHEAIAVYPWPTSPPAELLSEAQLMERRLARAERSQQHRYPADWVYEFVTGDGQAFDYGYNFSQCAAQLFFHAQGADEFLPFFCWLDFAFSRVQGNGLERSMTLDEGYALCNPRFKRGRQTEHAWPSIWR
ncbi:MAG: NUDIX domain-containing protein [Chloroflexi bacterium]|nr:NUDIX domain-containing protein [Chloroflexota bacterium]